MQWTVRAAVFGIVVGAAGVSAQERASAVDRSAQVADSLARAGNHAAARQAYERLVEAAPSMPGHWRGLAFAAYYAGDFARAAEAFARQAELTGNPTAVFNVAAMRARLGQRDSAFAWLERAAAAGFRSLQSLRTDTDLDSLRGDPRFGAIVSAVERNVTPCAFTPESRQFDFWVGEWEVRNPRGQVVGRSVVEPVSGRCALLENWTDGFGGTGKSLNAWNPLRKQWQQFWVGQGGAVTEFRDSHWNGSSLVFSAAGATEGVRRRLTFSPLSAETVRQLGERSQDAGVTWAVEYDFTYHRVRR